MRAKRTKKLRRRLSNAVLLIALLAIIVGIAYNIFNSRAEQKVEINAVALDNYGYLGEEDFVLEAIELSGDRYEIELPESVNDKMISEVIGITLQEKVNGEAIIPDEGQNTAGTKIEVEDNKFQVTKEQLELNELKLQVEYDIALFEKLENNEFTKELLSAKTLDEVKALELTDNKQLLYNKILKYEDEANGKLVEVKGFLPIEAELQTEQVSEQKLKEIFGNSKIDVAYDIKIVKQVVVDEAQQTIEYQEIKPEDFGENCEVSIKDSNIEENAQVYHVKEDNTFEEVEVKKTEEETVSFETRTFSIYAVSSDKSIMVAATDTKAPSIILGELGDIITAENLTTSDYGGYVTNYNFSDISSWNNYSWGYDEYLSNWAITSLGINGWRIFHTDGENIYLIADELITARPKGKNGTQLSTLTYTSGEDNAGNYWWCAGDGRVSALNTYVDYTGTSDISSNLKTKLLSQYTTTSTNINARATAYLLDTNIWAGLKDSNGYADYVIGSPTLELYTASYNAFYGTSISSNTNTTGYTTSYSGLDTTNYLYVNRSYTAGEALWLASPSGADSEDMMVVTENGSISNKKYNSYLDSSWIVDDGTFGVRPVIVLSSNVILQKTGDNSYNIVDSMESGNGGNTTWSTSQTETITIYDAGGLATGAQIQYGWSTSKSTEPTTWTTTTVTGYSTGATTASVDITTSGLTGKQYLWIKPVTVKDTTGNSQTTTKISTNQYYFDNVAPTVTATESNGNITITMADTNSGLQSAYGQYYLSTSGTELADGSWVSYTSGTKATLPAEETRTYYLFVKQVKDKAGNASAQYGTLTEISGTNYHRFGPYEVIEKVAPAITFGTNGNTTWAETHTETITISDNSGLVSGAQLQYAWSDSTPTLWTTVTLTNYSEGDQTASITVTGENLGGKQCLWVKPVTLKDVVGNSQTVTASSGEFYFDNAAPNIDIKTHGLFEEGTISAEDLTVEHYGGYVTNYNISDISNWDNYSWGYDEYYSNWAIENLGINGWRIFHSDGENIYLIADELITARPKGKNGTSVSTYNYIDKYVNDSWEYWTLSGDNRNFILNTYSDYTGTSDISSNIKNKLLSAYIEASTNINARATAYLLDTNIWAGLKDNSGYAEYAIGTPTLELYTASYNAFYGTSISSSTNTTGYTTSYSGLDTTNYLYINRNYNGLHETLWLASPSGASSEHMMVIKSDGSISNTKYNSYLDSSWEENDGAFGARPIICLKSDYGLEKTGNNTYRIVERQDGNETWQETQSATITISDDGIGLAERAEIQYGWSQSRTVEPDVWTNVTLTDYSEGAESASITVTGEGLDGKYYLWAKPVSVEDSMGHTQTETKISTSQYYFDNTAPTVTASQTGEDLTIIMTDAGSGPASLTGKYYLSTSSTELVGSEWAEYTSGAIIETSVTGSYYLFVETISDNVGRTSSLYGTIVEINGTNYHRFGPYNLADTAVPEITITTGSAAGITASTLTTEDYGGYVTNYTPTNGVNDEGTQWRIFHTDGENIYLIADSYVPLTNEAGTKNYVPTGYSNTSGRYGFDLMAYSNYNGTADIDSNIATKWLSKYTSAGYTATNTANNGKATAYLLDTNAWSGFKDSTYADYAVGGPTIELFAASYNKTHTDRTIETQVDEYGYDVAWSDEGFESYIRKHVHIWVERK